MFARFDENPAMTLRVIKETKRYGRTDGQRENSIPPTNKVCGGYNYILLSGGLTKHHKQTKTELSGSDYRPTSAHQRRQAMPVDKSV